MFLKVKLNLTLTLTQTVKNNAKLNPYLTIFKIPILKQ